MPVTASAQTVVISAGPDSMSVTVYRDPDRGEGSIDANFPQGFALVSETRKIAVPAGDATIRFEGVADGMIAVSALVTGLPGGVTQKNRDARLLSPAALLDGTLGNRVHLRRTSRATGKVTEQDVLIRSGADKAVVLQTADGIEALRCDGLPETLSYDSVPSGLSVKPTLSVTTHTPFATNTFVTLTYLTTGLDWGAHYVAKVADDGKTLDLFAWLTIANGNDTGFVDSQLLAVAGRLNRESDYDSLVERAPLPSLFLQCWPLGTTSTSLPPPPPPPPPPPAPIMAGAVAMRAEALEDVVVTARRRIAVQEDLGDLKLYRVPMRVDVNANGQKQVALLQKSAVPFQVYYRTRLSPQRDESAALTRMVRMRNRTADGLGLPLPSGGVALFEQHGDDALLLAESRLRDLAIGEMVEIEAGESPQVRIAQTAKERDEGGRYDVRTELTNALRLPAFVEVSIGDVSEGTLVSSGGSGRVSKKDGGWIWSATVPANGKAVLTYTYKEAE